MEITVEKTMKLDIPELQYLIAVSARGLSTVYYTSAQIESAIRYFFGVDTQLVTDGTYNTVKADGRLAGCGGWSKRNTLYGGDQHKEQEDPLLNPAYDAARIRAFFVHPGYARKGIGTMLINFCEAQAAKAGFTGFALGATLSGVPLYQAMGYETVENADALLPDREVLQIIKMRKRI